MVVGLEVVVGVLDGDRVPVGVDVGVSVDVGEPVGVLGVEVGF